MVPECDNRVEEYSFEVAHFHRRWSWTAAWWHLSRASSFLAPIVSFKAPSEKYSWYCWHMAPARCHLEVNSLPHGLYCRAVLCFLHSSNTRKNTSPWRTGNIWMACKFAEYAGSKICTSWAAFFHPCRGERTQGPPQVHRGGLQGVVAYRTQQLAFIMGNPTYVFLVCMSPPFPCYTATWTCRPFDHMYCVSVPVLSSQHTCCHRARQSKNRNLLSPTIALSRELIEVSPYTQPVRSLDCSVVRKDLAASVTCVMLHIGRHPSVAMLPSREYSPPHATLSPC